MFVPLPAGAAVVVMVEFVSNQSMALDETTAQLVAVVAEQSGHVLVVAACFAQSVSTVAVALPIAAFGIATNVFETAAAAAAEAEWTMYDPVFVVEEYADFYVAVAAADLVFSHVVFGVVLAKT
uniref:Putative secreted peptide n=1 Tax=Anopheles braziliensis TaxID=58242 RepID=A0A2M3ZQE1_9DIPT